MPSIFLLQIEVSLALCEYTHRVSSSPRCLDIEKTFTELSENAGSVIYFQRSTQSEMTYLLHFAYLLLPFCITCTPIPFISNVILFPRYLSNFTFVHHQSIEQCLCVSLPSFVAFNWFPNNTCQLFVTFPVSYRIQTSPQARLYFPRRVFPNASQCCMPDLGYLLERMRNGTWISVNVLTPRNLILDNNGYLVTVEMQPPKLDRFDAQNLSLISRTNISGSYAMAVGFTNNTYFAGLISGPIVSIDSTNLSVLSNFNSPFLQGIRAIIFYNQGRNMAVSATVNRSIVFLNRTGSASPSYAFTYQKLVSYPGVHGLTRVNDNLFYGTSYFQNSVYRYTAVANSFSWNETLLIDARPLWNVSGGTFVTFDECGRHWFSLETSAVHIFDNQGTLLGNFSLSVGNIMDTLITDNYVMYFSDRNTSGSRIIRIDPQIQC